MAVTTCVTSFRASVLCCMVLMLMIAMVGGIMMGGGHGGAGREIARHGRMPGVDG